MLKISKTTKFHGGRFSAHKTMILKGIDNQTVELKILKYQFPEINTPKDWDANWLHIYLKVDSKLGNWETVDPSLTTFEFKSLVSWFKDLAENREVKYRELDFTEPNLVFQLKDSTPKSKTVRVVFNYESKPRPAEKGKEYYVDCVFTNEQLADVSLQLENELKLFPER